MARLWNAYQGVSDSGSSAEPPASCSWRLEQCVTLATLFLVGSLASPAWAQDEANHSINDIHQPGGAYEEASNGVSVFLSSPRHSNSGDRGECDYNTPPHHGEEENVNGRRYNWYGGRGQYAYESFNPQSTARNLAARGYTNLVSQNTRDNGFAANRTMSENGGYDLHIVTHSNATTGCPTNTNYFLVMHRSGTTQAAARSNNLANVIGDRIDDVHPAGAARRWSAGLHELFTNSPLGTAYTELAFHDNPAGQVWMNGAAPGKTTAWRYGYAVDSFLGYP